ncbi:MAG TPA: carboxylesterase family protein, partial [Vicinamibacterales bacterium]|nr:carboxylesterase family protein [Vicinamibacterales bacterium]
MRSRRDFLRESGLLIAASGVGFARVFADEGTPVTVETSYGRVRGTDVAGIKTFKGIPYGASTAGRNRFKPPVAPAKWTGVRDAIAYGPSAPQREPGVGRNASPIAVAAAGLPAESEDCL